MYTDWLSDADFDQEEMEIEVREAEQAEAEALRQAEFEAAFESADPF